MEAPRFTKVKNCVFGGAEPERQVSQVKLGKLVEIFVNHTFSYGYLHLRLTVHAQRSSFTEASLISLTNCKSPRRAVLSWQDNSHGSHSNSTPSPVFSGLPGASFTHPRWLHDPILAKELGLS